MIPEMRAEAFLTALVNGELKKKTAIRVKPQGYTLHHGKGAYLGHWIPAPPPRTPAKRNENEANIEP